MDKTLVFSIITFFFSTVYAENLADIDVLSLSSSNAKLESSKQNQKTAKAIQKEMHREIYDAEEITQHKTISETIKTIKSQKKNTYTPNAEDIAKRKSSHNNQNSKTRHKNTQTVTSNASVKSNFATRNEEDNQESGTGIKLQVEINGITDEDQLNNAKEFLDLYEENEKAVKNPSYIDYLAKEGVEQIQNSLQPYGYYKSTVSLDNKRTESNWAVTYTVNLGAPVILRNVNIGIEGDGKNQKEYQALLSEYPLQPGDVLVQEKYKDFKGEIAAFATLYGYFDANYTRKKIAIDNDYENANIEIIYDTKHRYKFGKTTIKQDFLDDDVFERFLTFKENDAYSAKLIAETQRDLYNSNYVKMIDITAEPNKASQSVPVNFVITPKANKKHIFAIGYGTDTGARAKYSFDWRWVNRRGHRFKSDIYIAQKKQEIGLEYRIPAKKPATDYYKIFAYGKRNNTGDVESRMWNAGGAYLEKVNNWEREIGIKWQQEDFTLGNDHGDVGLLTPFGSLTYRKVDEPLNISRGLWLKGSVAGAHKSAGSDVSFLQAVGEAKAIRKFADKHKVKISGAMGRTWVDDFHQLPASYRFVTGGDRTIRGYSYGSIGDTDSTGDNIGGNKMYYLSGEYEYFFTDTMAAAMFVDAGDAYSAEKSSLKVGAGAGFHYYSPIGPIRLDIGHGFDEPGEKFRVHLNIGPEF